MRTLALLLPLVAVACASYDGLGLRPGVASEVEVRRTMGEPALEVRNPDGSRQMAYPRGPFGGHTYMVDVGKDGLVKGIRQVLNDDNFHRIQAGQTQDDVLRLIGPPYETGDFPRLQQVAWDYRYQDTWGYQAIFSVMFDREGRVVGKVTRRIERDRRFP